MKGIIRQGWDLGLVIAVKLIGKPESPGRLNGIGLNDGTEMGR
jgi:hypothetical protein